MFHGWVSNIKNGKHLGDEAAFIQEARIPWNYPPPSNSHQDYSIVSRESQPKLSFVTGILVGGVDQTYTWIHVKDLR